MFTGYSSIFIYGVNEMKKISARMWATLILIGLVGQFAWTIENMYFNVFLYNTISTDPRYISAMVGWSAAAATLTTLLMGALSDRVGKRKLFIARATSCGAYPRRPSGLSRSITRQSSSPRRPRPRPR